MPLLALSNELILIIAKGLEKPKDVSALLQANHRFAYLLTPVLYDFALQSLYYGETALFWAVVNGYEPMVKLLLEKGVGIEVKSLSKKLLHQAPSECGAETTRLVLEEGANIVIKDIYQEFSALQWAAFYGNTAMVALLLSKGADTSVQTSNSETALCLAVSRKHKTIINLLLEKVDVAFTDKHGRTALHQAAEHCGETAVRSLLDRGADPAVMDNDHLTPLLVAVQRGDEALESAKLLLERGASLEVQDILERRALHLAAAVKEGKGVKMLELLLERGADVNAQDNYRRTPLHVAIQYKCPASGLLLEKGAAINVQDIFGRTALLLAAQRGSGLAVKMLLDKGADVTIRDYCGRMVPESVFW